MCGFFQKMPGKTIALVVFCVFTQLAQAGIFGALTVPFRHPMASVILAAGGYATVQAYCKAGAPAEQITDDSGRARSARIDCAGIAVGLESKLGNLSERADASPRLLGSLKASVGAANTRELRKNLNVMQVGTGMPPDPDDCDAHHIVPQNEARPWAAKAAKAARAAIDGCVDIDSAENGVYLPNNRDGRSQCKGSYHKTLHTDTYYQDLAARLTRERARGGCAALQRELGVVKSLLQSGAL